MRIADSEMSEEPDSRTPSDVVWPVSETCSTIAEKPSEGGADCTLKTEFSSIYDPSNVS